MTNTCLHSTKEKWDDITLTWIQLKEFYVKVLIYYIIRRSQKDVIGRRRAMNKALRSMCLMRLIRGTPESLLKRFILTTWMCI